MVSGFGENFPDLTKKVRIQICNPGTYLPRWCVRGRIRMDPETLAEFVVQKFLLFILLLQEWMLLQQMSFKRAFLKFCMIIPGSGGTYLKSRRQIQRR